MLEKRNEAELEFLNRSVLTFYWWICSIMHATFSPICSSARVRQGRQEWRTCVMIPCWDQNAGDGFTFGKFAGLPTLIW